MPYVRKGIGQACDPTLYLCGSPVSVVAGGGDVLVPLQTGPYVQPLGTSPAYNTLAVAEAGLAANLPTYLMWGALAVGVVLVLGAVR